MKQTENKFKYIPDILSVFRGYGNTKLTFVHTWGQYMMVCDYELECFVFTDHQNKYSVFINCYETDFLYGYTKENEDSFNDFCIRAANRFKP